ncbi:TfoX/Sxy family protein [Dickeya zeae]|uniref:TfoX/Sxy family protein n=1 Tax=Dickeya zeae TaxID=204042 RepID=UPI001C639C4C|nr:TfoX/Sxy family protein [Dickeya zeae]
MDEFAQYMLDVFRFFGRVSLRRMFAGYGLFREGVMFGFVYDETLYLKADVENVGDFQNQGLRQFEYARQGKVVRFSCYQAPDFLLEDPHEAALWARRSFEASIRANASKSSATRTERLPS